MPRTLTNSERGMRNSVAAAPALCAPRSALVLVLLSSLFYIASFPKFNLSFLAWIALAPLVFVVWNETPRNAFVIGWISGTLAYMGLLYWVIVTFLAAHLSIFLAFTCLLLLSAYLGLYWGVWAWFIRKSSTRSPIAGAAAWVVLEYIRTYLFSGFPWTLLGDSQWRHLSLIQIASLTGVYGVSFLIALVNLTLALAFYVLIQLPLPVAGEGGREGGRRISRTLSLILSREGRGFLTSLGLTLCLLIACYLFGRHRLAAHAAEAAPPPMQVALLQGNIDQYKKWDKAYVDAIERTFEQLTIDAAAERPDLIVWPETSVPGYLLQDPPLRAWLFHVVHRTGTSHLVGAPSLDAQRNAYNSAFLLSPQAEIRGQYDKTHLVPFGEVVPWEGFLGRWIHVLNDLGGFTAGRRLPVLPSLFGGIGVNICYEAIFPDLIRRSVLQGAAVIANLTNDGWYMRTAAPYQHFIPNIFRAIENDRWVIRSDNTGITGIIDPQGHVIATSPIFEPAVIEGKIYPHHDLTFYTRFGDVFAGGCSLFCFALSLRAILRRL